MHRVVIGRTRELRGPDALEQGMAGLAIAVAMTVAVWFGTQLAHMTQTLDAVTLASGAELNEIVYHSVHGQWPSPDDPNIISKSSHGHHAEKLSLGGDGVITAELALGSTSISGALDTADAPGATHGYLSFRPELLGSRAAPTATFLCGYAKPIAAAIATRGANRTTLARKDIPPFCR